MNPISVWFFPRASQRRVLLHLHVFTSSSHLLIFLSSYLQIFRSSHLHIFSLSLSPLLSLPLSVSCPLSLSLSFFFLSLLNPQAVPTRRNEVATFVVRLAQNAFFFSTFLGPAATFSHETRFECQKTAVKLRFWSVETRFECQKLRSNCDFGWSGRSPFARNVVRASKTNAFLPFWSVGGNPCQKLLFFFCNFGWSGGYPFARNEVRVSKTAVQLAATLSHETRFASKTTGFLRVWLVRRLPFRTKRGSSVKNWGFLVSLVGPVKGSACTSACV